MGTDEALRALRHRLEAHKADKGLSLNALITMSPVPRTAVSSAFNAADSRPEKETVIGLARTLECTEAETQELLRLWEQATPRVSQANRKRTWAYASIALASLAAGGLVFWVLSSTQGQEEGPLVVTTKWPTVKECDGATSVAMPDEGKAITAFDPSRQNFRSVVTEPRNKGGSWGSGHLYLDLSAKDGKTVTIDEIHLSTRLPKKISSPKWVALTAGGCGGIEDRVFSLDLDKPSLVDKGIEEGAPAKDAPPVRTNPLGSSFTVSAKDPAVVRVDASACRGNYEWSLVVEYSYDGANHGHPLTKKVGPFKTFSVAGQDTVSYTPDMMSKDAGSPTPMTDSPTGCPVTS
jgi:hypothetical protein